SVSTKEMSSLRRYVGKEYVSVPDLIRLAYSSVAARAIVPMQDVLGLGSEARINTPGTTDGNWAWRLDGAVLMPDLATRLQELAKTYGR
ncbi:MAG: 4-alpha-glucanotransferase, partial [Rubrobacter sp.]|nr:4-alpha-glucanotransferase [Rubrobacter sp.]